MAAHAHLASELAGIPIDLLLNFHLPLPLAQALASLWTEVYLTIQLGEGGLPY